MNTGHHRIRKAWADNTEATTVPGRRTVRRASLLATALLSAVAGLATFGYGATATVPTDDVELLPEGVYRTSEVTPTT